MNKWNQNQKELLKLIEKIFDDGKLDPSEKAELKYFWTHRAMTATQVLEVVEKFVSNTWQETIEDGLITDEEHEKLRTIVDGLHLPADIWPEKMRQLIS